MVAIAGAPASPGAGLRLQGPYPGQKLQAPSPLEVSVLPNTCQRVVREASPPPPNVGVTQHWLGL